MARFLIRQPLSSGPATLFASTIVFLRGELGVPSARIADAQGWERISAERQNQSPR